jgi:hypothetical protein
MAREAIKARELKKKNWLRNTQRRRKQLKEAGDFIGLQKLA